MTFQRRACAFDQPCKKICPGAIVTRDCRYFNATPASRDERCARHVVAVRVIVTEPCETVPLCFGGPKLSGSNAR